MRIPVERLLLEQIVMKLYADWRSHAGGATWMNLTAHERRLWREKAAELLEEPAP